MRQVTFEKYGLITPSVKKSVLRHVYRDLVGDQSAAETTSQAEVDARVGRFFDLEEPDIVFDFRHVYSGNKSMFDLFWAKANEFLEEDVGTAVDDRRHSEVVHLAKTFSVRDLREQVLKSMYTVHFTMRTLDILFTLTQVLKYIIITTGVHIG